MKAIVVKPTQKMMRQRMNYEKILRCTISPILPAAMKNREVMKHNIFTMKRAISRKQIKNILCALAVCCLGTTVHEAVAQCGTNPIQGFDVTQINNTTDGEDDGTIAVAVRGGQGPFIYTLVADYGGKGKETIHTSSSTPQTTYLFRDVAANNQANSIGYIVEVQSSNRSEANYPALLCQRRMVSNIEVK